MKIVFTYAYGACYNYLHTLSKSINVIYSFIYCGSNLIIVKEVKEKGQ